MGHADINTRITVSNNISQHNTGFIVPCSSIHMFSIFFAILLDNEGLRPDVESSNQVVPNLVSIL